MPTKEKVQLTIKPLIPSEYSYKFSYFNVKGLGEVSRFLFAIAGQEYEDFRYPLEVLDMQTYQFKKEEFDEDKSNGLLEKSLNKVPFLNVTIKSDLEANITYTICQSKAIERFLAKQFNLFGDNDIDSALIDSLCECVRDIKDAYQVIKKSENKEENLNKWFEETLKEKLEMLEKLLGERLGFSVGNKLSLSDVVIFYFLTEFFDNKEGTINSYKNCPKICTIIENLNYNENLNNWLKNRPQTNF